MEYNVEQLLEKWSPVLDNEDSAKIADPYRRKVTAILLENQERDTAVARQQLVETHANASGALPNTGGVAAYDPVLISLVRRAMPQLIAYDICGVQPMTLPTGLIFAMKSRYNSQSGDEALFNEADSGFGGAASPTQVGSNPVNGGQYTTGVGQSTTTAESGSRFNEMAFSIERTPVVAKSRQLKAEYTVELQQDMKSVHGLDAESELSSILSTEILSEINREVIRTMFTCANVGASAGTTTAGTFDLDVDSNGRWSVERFKGLLFQLEREANVISQKTRRGRGNFIVASSDVVSALAMSGVLDYAPALSTNLNVDEANTTFAGILNGKYKVYIDPFTANGGANPQFAMVGYKGSSPFDAGIFYCPYVPLQRLNAVDPTTFQPKIAFKTRYGMAANPFTTLDASGTAQEGLNAGNNYYYRKIKVANLM